MIYLRKIGLDGEFSFTPIRKTEIFTFCRKCGQTLQLEDQDIINAIKENEELDDARYVCDKCKGEG